MSINSNKQKKKILVVAAHPDHEVFSSGGTILKRIADGDEAYLLTLSEGLTARYKTRDQVEPEKLQALHDAYYACAKFMQFKEIFFHQLPDNRMDSVDLLDIVKMIEEVKQKVKPDIIYTDYEGDVNIDHQITFQAVLSACRPISGDTVQEIYASYLPSSTEWTSPLRMFRPNVFVDITETIEKKKKAARFYESEMRPFPHPRSLEAVEATAKYFGTFSGLLYAEPFLLIRKISK